MTTVWRFLAKFASLIVCTRHCFDRVIFKGHLTLSAPSELERFVDHILKVRRSHFMNVIAPGYSDQLVEHAKGVAAAAERTYLYRCGSFRKDQWAEQLIREQRIAKLNWPAILNRDAHQVNPLLHQVLGHYRVRWVVDQAEFATDLLLTSPAALTGLYQKLLPFATVTFTPKDILGFLGRKWDRRLDGEVQTEVKTDRVLGTRIKHRMTKNWLKIYDQFGRILRVETVINRPQEFSVFRTRFHRDGSTAQGFFPMNKEVANLVYYQQQALACNQRYLDALAVVDDPAPADQELRQLTEPKVVAGRSMAGFNPARREDVRLFAAVRDGDHIARGFRNKDLRAALFSSDAKPSPQRSAAVGRLVKRLHVRHLVAKIPRTRRWRVTARGRHLLTLAMKLYHQTWPELLAA